MLFVKSSEILTEQNLIAIKKLQLKSKQLLWHLSSNFSEIILLGIACQKEKTNEYVEVFGLESGPQICAVVSYENAFGIVFDWKTVYI